MLNSVCRNAQQMVDEVRRQMRENPGILTGEVKPDYCPADICTRSGIAEMKKPVLVSLLAPIVGGFVFDPYLSAVFVGYHPDSCTAMSTANSGTWDNAKKYVNPHKPVG